jgi:hypothetical protein
MKHLYETLEVDLLIFSESRKESDENGDGTPEQIAFTTYDTQGNQTVFQNDEGADGTIDFVRDARGNETRLEEDFDGDGVDDFVQRFEYDADGNMTREEIDSNADGDDHGPCV